MEKGEHEIRVCVDNTFTEASALHIANDYYTYGGITRPVVLENIADIYVKYIHFTPYTKENKWFAKTEVVVCNVSDRDKSLCRWSEDYQARLLKDTLEEYMNEDEISGVFIWQFADCRVTDEKANEKDIWWQSRAR